MSKITHTVHVVLSLPFLAERYLRVVLSRVRLVGVHDVRGPNLALTCKSTVEALRHLPWLVVKNTHSCFLFAASFK